MEYKKKIVKVVGDSSTKCKDCVGEKFFSKKCMNLPCCMECCNDGHQIVYVNKPARKVARCYVKDIGKRSVAVLVKFNQYDAEITYANRRNAIRGARRFCAAIGHECVIVDEAKGGDK